MEWQSFGFIFKELSKKKKKKFEHTSELLAEGNATDASYASCLEESK